MKNLVQILHLSRLLQIFTGYNSNIAQTLGFSSFRTLAEIMISCYNLRCEGVKNVEGVTKMATTETIKTEKVKKSKFNDEFESYLKKQCLKTTFNGSEVETFSWYRKVLGLA